MEAAMIRSPTAGRCAIANSIQQEKWERASSSSGCVIAGLGSDFLCKKAFLVPKNSKRTRCRVGRFGPVCQKMFVPGFGEASPEAQAAGAMHNFFTYIAVKIVSSQLEDYNKEAYVDLMAFLEKMSLKDGDKFIAALMRESFRHKNLALRIMEVRSAYANQDFEWDNLQNLSAKKLEEANTSLMRKFLTETSNME